MAEEKRYTREELARLEELEKRRKEAEVVERLKKEEAATARERFNLTREEETIKREEERSIEKAKETTDKYKEEIATEELISAAVIKDLPGKEIKDLTDKEIEDLVQSTTTSISQEDLTALEIYQPAESTSIQDVIDILETREVVPATKIVNFDLNYRIEPIPTPDSNKINSLTTADKNVFDKPYYKKNSAGVFAEIHILKNFITQNGKEIKFVVGGAPKTKYQLQVFNETDSTYYDWGFAAEVVTPTRTINDKIAIDPQVVNMVGKFRNGFTFYQGEIQDNGKEIVSVNIPAVSKETVYKVRFVQFDISQGLVDYGPSTPLFGVIEQCDYVITQLMNPTTTIKIDSNASHLRSVTENELTINHTPCAKLNNAVNNGEYTINLKVDSRKPLSISDNLIGNVVTTKGIISGETKYDETEIIKTDLLASVSNKDGLSSGTVSGTITLGKTAFRNAEVLINPSYVFKTN